MSIERKKTEFVSDELLYRRYIIEAPTPELERDLIDVYDISSDQLMVILLDRYIDQGLKDYQVKEGFTAYLRLNGNKASFMIEKK